MKEWIKELCPEIADWQAELIAEAAQKRVEAEREACAKVCEEMRTYVDKNNAVIQSSSSDCAAAIRARGQA